MSKPFTVWQPLAPGHRLAAAAAALTAGIGSLGAMLLVFDGASPARWVQPDTELVQAIAACDRAPERGLRDRCKQALAQAVLARASAATVLAQR